MTSSKAAREAAADLDRARRAGFDVIGWADPSQAHRSADHADCDPADCDTAALAASFTRTVRDD